MTAFFFVSGNVGNDAVIQNSARMSILAKKPDANTGNYTLMPVPHCDTGSHAM